MRAHSLGKQKVQNHLSGISWQDKQRATSLCNISLFLTEFDLPVRCVTCVQRTQQILTQGYTHGPRFKTLSKLGIEGNVKPSFSARKIRPKHTIDRNQSPVAHIFVRNLAFWKAKGCSRVQRACAVAVMGHACLSKPLIYHCLISLEYHTKHMVPY